MPPVRILPDVAASGAIPSDWIERPIETTAIYCHRQWCSPSGATRMGIVYLHLPVPLGADTILWLAEQHFANIPGQSGKVIAQWIDPLSRSWFTAKSAKVSVSGYIMTDGGSAWIAYSGYKLESGLRLSEQKLAAQCLNTIVPLGDKLPTTRPTPHPNRPTGLK